MANTPRYNMPGPIDEPQETNSGLDLLPTNRTLIAMPFKGEESQRQPEEIPNDKSVSTEAVMEYARPEVRVKLKTGDPENSEVEETIPFRGGIESFTINSIKKNSPHLRRLDAEFKVGESLVDRIDKSAKFRQALDNSDARAAIVAMLRDIIDELDKSIKEQVSI